MLLQNNRARDSFLKSLFFIFSKDKSTDSYVKKIPPRLKEKESAQLFYIFIKSIPISFWTRLKIYYFLSQILKKLRSYKT